MAHDPITCPGCNQTLFVRPDGGGVECGGEDNGGCCESFLAYDVLRIGYDAAVKEWREVAGDDAEPPSLETLAEIREAHERAYASFGEAR